jgi:hypothetical protein
MHSEFTAIIEKDGEWFTAHLPLCAWRHEPGPLGPDSLLWF